MDDPSASPVFKKRRLSSKSRLESGRSGSPERESVRCDSEEWQSDSQKDMFVSSPTQQNSPVSELDRMCDKYFDPNKGDFNFSSQSSDPEPNEISIIKDENLHLKEKVKLLVKENDALKLKIEKLSRNADEAVLKENLSLKEELDSYKFLLLAEKNTQSLD